MARYRLKLRGCDDVTHMFFDLTDEEAALLRRVSTESARVSQFDCMPTMHLEEVRDGETEEAHPSC